MISTFYDPFGVLNNDDYVELMKNFKNMQKIDISTNETEQCKQCGAILRRSINNINNFCIICGITTEDITDEDIDINEIMNNKLRIVGSNSNQFQADMYRSDSVNNNILHKKQILNEYKEYRRRFIEKGERAFPLNVCELATVFYNKIQQQCVKRNQNKKSIMAACLWQACLCIDFAPSKIEISKFMQLSHKGIAKGNNFIRTMVSDGQLDIDPNKNTIYPEIKTLFIQLEYIGDHYKKLHDIINNIIHIAIDNSIGINSLTRSKVIGTTYIVLRRSKHWNIIDNVPANTKEFCKNKIRKNTIDRFINEISSYHSFFKDYYTSAGLIDTLEY